MTNVHTEYPEDTTGGLPVVPCPWCDPNEPTGSDNETEPLATVRELRPIVERTEKWRLYKSEPIPGRAFWYALQPATLDQAYFRTGYGTTAKTYPEALRELQLALAKAAA
jgi:hypothetical protein